MATLTPEQLPAQQTIQSPQTLQISPQQVYSAANIQQAATSPATRPDLSDPYGLRDYFYNSPEISTAKNEVASLNQQILNLNQKLRNTTVANNNALLSMNDITGANRAAAETVALPLQALSENLLAKRSYLDTLISDADAKYQIAREQRDQIQQLISATGGKAGIHWGMTFEEASKKATDYLEKKAKKDAIKQLYMQTFGSSGKGLSSKEMEKKLKKEYKSKKAYEQEMQALELAAKRQSLAGGGGTASQRAGAIVSNAQGALLASRGTDGYVDPGVYARERAKYAAETGDVTGFDSQFAGLLSSQEQKNIGVQVSGSTSKSGLTPAQKTQIADFDSTIQSARDAASLAKNVNTGFISGRVGKIGQSLGFASENFVNLNAKLSQVKSNFMKALAGANVTESERKRLEAFLPDVNDSEKTIQTKLSNFVTELERQRDNLQIQGGGTGQIRVIRKSDGAEGYISANEFDPSEYTMI